jgi:hypothetical protein
VNVVAPGGYCGTREEAMWNVPIAAIPGPWPAVPQIGPWAAAAAAGALLLGLAFVLVRAAGRPRARRRPAGARLGRLHGVRAA